MAGRPREFDREEALRKAKQVFWQRGYEGTSISDLVAVLGIASARIYAAFGSKENLFREAVALYLSEEGAFADAAMQEPDTRQAIKQLLGRAVEIYTRENQPHGCMVVLSLTNYTSDNEALMTWLADSRRERTAGIIQRIEQGVQSGDVPENTDIQALGDYIATLLHGISIQARDGVSRTRLLAMTDIAMRTFDVMTASPGTH
ncbi:TetR/AcrR family transcriptional regulator [Morganella psychrotolerans]|uniref:TetR/AcrR family transcriptional regulator n=1 Tax=Morganella psychrotolerans TaxID=368603 RepID=A0A5M9RB93_9GAMM|nr:TetR/AcrR family transcriptional regulator [Morganella psychrotolerans]KAA8717783.1 TetR/AcrR family transcriptional regulator [Morganella psychrotolerans]OBU07981.1 TetR family transcriptional regulator [Morganella psychrotolerans]